jgi:hypothetical protein
MKKKSILTIGFSILIFTSLFSIVFAHPGRTDAYGCHTCRTNCSNWGLSYGEYHCHNAKDLPQPQEPIKSTFGEGGTGYTAPAPEYRVPAVVIPKVTPVEPSKIVTSQTAASSREDSAILSSLIIQNSVTEGVSKLSFWSRLWGWLSSK